MHFCNNCENMYYIEISKNNNNKLSYYCRNCGNRDENLGSENTTILKTKIKLDNKVYSHIINKYTKNDVTLPRINTIKCPNQECPSNKKEKENEVIYIRYDNENMKYIYLCVNCDTTWKTNDKN
jgi:DNA-directed RNA polymerase subunit M/transcription elongation factor TFIIS